MGISALECFAISMRLTNEALESKDTDRIALRGLGASSTESLSPLPSGSMVMSLSANDELKVNVNQTLYSDGNNWIRFSGF